VPRVRAAQSSSLFEQSAWRRLPLAQTAAADVAIDTDRPRLCDDDIKALFVRWLTGQAAKKGPRHAEQRTAG